MRAAVWLVLLATACSRGPEDHRERRLLGFIVEPFRGCPAPRDPIDELRIANQRSKTLIREGRWKEAKESFERLLELNPQFGNGEVQRYLARCDVEVANIGHFDAAAGHLERGELAAAANELKEGSVDTVQLDRRDQLQARLRDQIDVRLGEATALISEDRDLKKLEELVAITDAVIAADPSNAAAYVLKQTAEQKRLRWLTFADPAPLSDAEHRAHRVAAIRSLFASGDVAGALAFANSCAPQQAECRTLRVRLEKFSGLLPGFTDLKAPQLKLLFADAKNLSGLETGGAAGRVIQTQLDQLKR